MSNTYSLLNVVDDPQLGPLIVKCCCEPKHNSRDDCPNDLQAICPEDMDPKTLIMEDLELRLRMNAIDIADLEEDISKQEETLGSLMHRHGVQKHLRQSVKNRLLELIERRKGLEEVRTKLLRQRLCALDKSHRNPTELKDEMTLASEPSNSTLKLSTSTDSNDLYLTQGMELRAYRNPNETNQSSKGSQGDAVKPCPPNTEWSHTGIAQNQEVQKIPTNGGAFQGRNIAPLATVEEYAIGLVSSNNPFRRPQYRIHLDGSSTVSETDSRSTPESSAVSELALTSTNPQPITFKATHRPPSSGTQAQHQSLGPLPLISGGIACNVHDDTDLGPENGETPNRGIDQTFSTCSGYSYEDDSDSESDLLSSKFTSMEDSSDEEYDKFEHSSPWSFLSGFAALAFFAPYAMYSATVGFITHMPDGSKSTQRQENNTSSDWSSAGVRSRKRRKQTSQDDSRFPEDEEDGSIQRRESRASSHESDQARFACPYYKHKPEVHQTRACSGPGWDKVRRVK